MVDEVSKSNAGDIAEILSRLGEVRAVVETQGRESARRHEDHARSANELKTDVTLLRTELRQQTKRIDAIESEQGRVKRERSASSQDLSDHMKLDAENGAATASHIGKIDTSLIEVKAELAEIKKSAQSTESATTAQDVVLEKQTGMLAKLQRHGVITAIGTIIGAAVAAGAASCHLVH